MRPEDTDPSRVIVDVGDMTEDEREAYEERVAIMMVSGHQSQQAAEYYALRGVRAMRAARDDERRRR